MSYFLNQSNHQQNIPLDYISYHNYVTSGSRDMEKVQVDFFNGADDFLQTVRNIEKIRLSLSPTTKTTINELGSFLPEEGTKPDPQPIPKFYFELAGKNISINGLKISKSTD